RQRHERHDADRQREEESASGQWATTMIVRVRQGQAGAYFNAPDSRKSSTSLHLGHFMYELIDGPRRVAAPPRSSPGVILDAERWELTVGQAFDGSVVEVDVGRAERRSALDATVRVPPDHEAVILRCDLDGTVIEAPDRVVRTPMPVEEF